MPYNIQTSFNAIAKTNSLIEKGELEGENGALASFIEFLEAVKEIGSYLIENWQPNLTEQVYKFGQNFGDRSPVKFIEEIEERIKENNPHNLEFLYFILSEIKYNSLPTAEAIEELNKLVASYPFNPEFRQTISTFHIHNGNFSEAIKQIDIAFRYCKKEPFKSTKFAAEYSYVNQLIEKGEYIQAQLEIDRIMESKIYKEETIRNNTFVDMRIRVKDLMIFHEKISTIEQKIKERIDIELDKDRKRVIEVLGFFSAIIAFILATVSLGKNFSFLEAIYFIFALGIILILFSISMSILFNSNSKNIWKSPQIWLLIISLVVLLFFILCSEGISIIVSRFT